MTCQLLFYTLYKCLLNSQRNVFSHYVDKGSRIQKKKKKTTISNLLKESKHNQQVPWQCGFRDLPFFPFALGCFMTRDSTYGMHRLLSNLLGVGLWEIFCIVSSGKQTCFLYCELGLSLTPPPLPPTPLEYEMQILFPHAVFFNHSLPLTPVIQILSPFLKKKRNTYSQSDISSYFKQRNGLLNAYITSDGT